MKLKKLTELASCVAIMLSSQAIAGTLYWYVDDEGVTHFDARPNLGSSDTSGQYDYDDLVDPPPPPPQPQQYNQPRTQYYNEQRPMNNYDDPYYSNGSSLPPSNDQQPMYFDNNSLNNVQDRGQVISTQGNLPPADPNAHVEITNEDVLRMQLDKSRESESNNQPLEQNYDSPQYSVQPRNNPRAQYRQNLDPKYNEQYVPRYNERRNINNQRNEQVQQNIPRNNIEQPRRATPNNNNIINMSSKPYHAEDFE